VVTGGRKRGPAGLAGVILLTEYEHQWQFWADYKPNVPHAMPVGIPGLVVTRELVQWSSIVSDLRK
jgi:hypothetical protein